MAENTEQTTIQSKNQNLMVHNLAICQDKMSEDSEQIKVNVAFPWGRIAPIGFSHMTKKVARRPQNLCEGGNYIAVGLLTKI
jgi:hypothetical protein